MRVPGRKPGRPRKVLDTALIEKLAGIGCPNYEIATHVGCNVDTLTDNYSEFLEKGRNSGKTSLRAKMHEVARKGNVPMLIHLSKHELGMKDHVAISADREAAELISELLGVGQEANTGGVES